MLNKQFIKTFLVGATIICATSITNSANAQRSRVADRLEDVKDRREDVRDRREDVRDRKEDRRDRRHPRCPRRF
jgi:cyclic nucleotide gated channel beta 1